MYNASWGTPMMRLLVLASCLLFVLLLFAQVRTARTEPYIPTLEQLAA